MTTPELTGPAPARILIVDDIADNRELLRLMLSTEGFDLQTASDGEEALAMIAQSPPSLVLLDVMMPRMSGCQVATAIKGDARTRNIPVIMVTAYDDREAKIACLAAGAEDFLTKPVDRIELCMRVRNLLRLHDAIADANRARAAAEQAGTSKSKFLRAVTHELRTPLNAIFGFTEILETGIRGAVNPAQSKDLGRIKRASHHLLHLVDDVLTISGMEGVRQLVPVSVPLEPVFDTVMGLCAVQAAEKGITVTVAPLECEFAVTADAKRCQQVLLNLVSNAIDYSPNGGTVLVSCDHDATMTRVCIASQDRGHRDVEHAFEPFADIEATAGPNSYHGIGLGLSISRELARAMHGDVTLQSVSGTGSTLSLSLPSAPSSAVELTRPIGPSRAVAAVV